MPTSLTIYQDKVFDHIQRDFEVELLADDCLFTEGPVWHPDGYYLFSDIPANRIYKIQPGKRKECYLDHSGTTRTNDPDLKEDQKGSNALALLHGGALLICQHGNHALSMYNGREMVSLISSYRGKPLNSPNDLVVHTDGSIYFSDPPYGLKDGKLNPDRYQPLAGVYRYFNGQLELIEDGYQYPNGVCLSPDGSRLFVCSNKLFEKRVQAYDTSTQKFLSVFAEENSDGIKCDRSGNVYLCNKDGIIILDPQGKRMALIPLPTVPANICWGGYDGKDLLITARQNVFLIRGFLL